MSSNLPARPALNYPEDAGQSRFRLMLAALAREVVMQLETVDVILARKGITQAQYDKILKNPYYSVLLAEATEAWKSAGNTEQRTKIQAAFLLEQAMPGYFVRITDNTEQLNAVNEGMKFLARVAGVGEAKAGPDGGKFIISINLGQGKLIEHEVKTIEATPNEPENPHGSNAPK